MVPVRKGTLTLSCVTFPNWYHVHDSVSGPFLHHVMVTGPLSWGLSRSTLLSEREPQERRPQEYVWLLVLDSNWLVDRVQPVSNPGLRVTHSWGTSFLLGGIFSRARLKPQFNHKELNWTNETPNQTGFLFVIILGLLVLPYGKKLPVILVLTNRNPVWFGGFYLLKQDFMSVTLGLELSLERKVTPQTKYSRTWKLNR